MEALKRELCGMLWNQATAESLCIGWLQRLLRSVYLRERDRKDIKETIQDEVKHRKTMERLAKQFGPRTSYPILQRTRYWREILQWPAEETIVPIVIGERFSWRVLKGTEKVLRAAGAEKAAEAFQHVIQDEREHLRKNDRLLRRLCNHLGCGTRVRRRWRAELRSRSHSKTQRAGQVFYPLSVALRRHVDSSR